MKIEASQFELYIDFRLNTFHSIGNAHSHDKIRLDFPALFFLNVYQHYKQYRNCADKILRK
jgi:hypothetical protein